MMSNMVLSCKAAAAQSAYARSASNAEGVDRHLLGLKLCVGDGELLPEIFADPMYSRSSHWQLSTSTLASEYFVTWGFGEVNKAVHTAVHTAVCVCLSAKGAKGGGKGAVAVQTPLFLHVVNVCYNNAELSCAL